MPSATPGSTGAAPVGGPDGNGQAVTSTLDIRSTAGQNTQLMMRVTGDTTGRVFLRGDAASQALYMGDGASAPLQVVTRRKTGWAAATGTATRTTFATDTVTLINLARATKALIDDLIAHGLIGA
jgi:hypothetical protein